MLKAPRPCHRRQKPGAVEEFKMNGWAQELEKLEIAPGEPVRFWVMDEARFGLHTVARRVWGLRGERVVVPFQQKLEWDRPHGAISILDGGAVFAHLPTVSCEATWLFLRELAKTQPEAHHVVLWDGAGVARTSARAFRSSAKRPAQSQGVRREWGMGDGGA